MSKQQLFPIEILTPEGEIFNQEVEMLSTRTTVGEIGVKARHEPLLALLVPTELRLYKSDQEILRFAQGEGYLQIANGKALLLLEEAFRPQELDHKDLQAKLDTANEMLQNKEQDSEAYATALRDKRRWEAFLRIQ